MRVRRWLCLALAAGLLATGGAAARAADAGDWIGTWGASPQPMWTADFPAPPRITPNLWNQTVRELATVSLGGSRVRVLLTNEYGQRPLVVGAAHVAIFDKGAAIAAGTDRPLTFGGRPSITIPPEAPAISDPVDLAVAPLATLAVSLYLPEVTPITTFHWEGRQTAAIVAGDHVADLDFKPDSTTTTKVFLSEVMVEAGPGARAVVAFGDSITDGDGSTFGASRRWTDDLARRLAARAGPPVAVVNQGISGARMLRDRLGANALARFDADVLVQPRADVVVLMMGINDIGWPGTVLSPDGILPTADQIVAGYEQLIARAHLRGLRIVGATLTPFEDAFHGTPLFGYYSPAKDAIREAVNRWIRESGRFDAVLDFDALVRDPTRPAHIKAAFDSGDHLHPNDAGYQAMADAVDLDRLLGAP